jgi:Protein of unknown function (DUF3822)
LNPTFKIESSETAVTKAKLLFMVSLDAVSFIILDGGNNCIALQSYHLVAETNLETTAAQLKDIVSSQGLFKQDFEKIIIIYAYPTAIIAPGQFAGESIKKEMLNLVFGEQNDALIKTDVDDAKDRHTIYTVPKQVESVMNYLFSSHTSKHLYSLLPAIPGLTGNELYCILCNNNFTAMLLKDGELQAIQTYQYKCPEDVVYYLLHLCESFEVVVNDTTVHLNGMISEQSNLYNEISKYFLNLQFESLPAGITYPEAMSEYPAHYFSHLFAIAPCV